MAFVSVGYAYDIYSFRFKGLEISSREIPGAPNSRTPLPISFPYHSHSSRDSYGSGMGMGVPLFGSLEFSWFLRLKKNMESRSMDL